MKTRFPCLGQCNLHYFLGDTLDLDVHLQRVDTVLGACNLEVHVAQVIFIAQNVGQYRKTVSILDQAHRDTSDVILHRHAGIHHCQTTAADGSHGGRAV